MCICMTHKGCNFLSLENSAGFPLKGLNFVTNRHVITTLWRRIVILTRITVYRHIKSWNFWKPVRFSQRNPPLTEIKYSQNKFTRVMIFLTLTCPSKVLINHESKLLSHTQTLKQHKHRKCVLSWRTNSRQIQEYHDPAKNAQPFSHLFSCSETNVRF